MPSLSHPVIREVITKNGEIVVKLEITLNLNVGQQGAVEGTSVTSRIDDLMIPQLSPGTEMISFGTKENP